jgi:hypothetical protein
LLDIKTQSDSRGIEYSVNGLILENTSINDQFETIEPQEFQKNDAERIGDFETGKMLEHPETHPDCESENEESITTILHPMWGVMGY